MIVAGVVTRRCLLAVVTVLLPVPRLRAQAPLCEQIRAITEEPAVVAAHWGISVTSLDGTQLCTINATQLFRPASNAKLFTTIAALALLGPHRTFTTRVASAQAAINGTIAGDLTIYGSGDAYLSGRRTPYESAPEKNAPPAVDPLEQMADAIAASGLKHITGGIVGDDTAWPFEPYPLDWSIDDMLWGYGAPVSALSVQDNQILLTIIPNRVPGGAALVATLPVLPYYELRSTVTTVRAGAPARIGIERLPGSRIVRVFGSVAVGTPVLEELAIDDPAEYAAQTLRQLLLEKGIAIDGEARAKHSKAIDSERFEEEVAKPLPNLPKTPLVTDVSVDYEGPALASHVSPPLLEDVTITLKVSQNLHAELLLHQLSTLYGSGGLGVMAGNDGSTANGIRVLRQFWVNAGLNPVEFTLYDGSGLSGHDLTTPHALTQVLSYAARQPWFAGFKAALPVGGVDGTLASRFTGVLKGKVFAKTGTLGESRALSGYVTTAGGSTLIFSILADNHPPSSSADRSAMDRIVEKIAASQ